MTPLQPPLSPALLAGLLLPPVPQALIDRALVRALKAVLARHPKLFSRLPDWSGKERAPLLVIDPVDLPLSLAFVADKTQPALRVAAAGDEDLALAVVRGPVEDLIDLAEGRVDGDALFFSRDLVFEGDTEIVVALRNALDGAEIKLADLVALPQPLARVGLMAGRVMTAVYRRAERDLDLLRNAALRPAVRRADGQASKIAKLESRIEELEIRLRRKKARGEKLAG